MRTDHHDAWAVRHPGGSDAAPKPEGDTMSRTTSSATAALIALLLVGLQAGCNTTAGVGKDVSAVGDAVTDTAEENKGY